MSGGGSRGGAASVRWSRHHVVGKRYGGREVVVIPIEDHALTHFKDFINGGDRFDFDAFAGQFGQMTKEQQRRTYELIEVRTKRKVRFIG